jgi:hypothetical protein
MLNSDPKTLEIAYRLFQWWYFIYRVVVSGACAPAAKILDDDDGEQSSICYNCNDYWCSVHIITGSAITPLL